MTAFSTFSQHDADGSTAPIPANESRVGHKRRLDEATEIRAKWGTSDGSRLADRFDDQQLLRRHKSLILNLVLADCNQVLANATPPSRTDEGQSPDLESIHVLAERYAGLGDSLERSIVRQLEVQQFIGRNPNLLDWDSHVHWPTPGERFRGFDVVEELGRGAIARVFLCRQRDLGGRFVVLKISFGGAHVEAPLLGRLHHPHVVPVHSAQFDGDLGVSLICMPFLGRSTFADLVGLAFRDSIPRHGSVIQDAAGLWLTEEDQEYFSKAEASYPRSVESDYVNGVVALIEQLADGLGYAHAKGVIHGDVKPSNVLLSFAGSPLLFDFNLGRDASAYDGPTGGTLPYMAPEQVRYLASGKAELLPAPTVASDVFSFGALLYEMLSGKPPFSPRSTASEKSELAAKEMLLLQRAGHESAARLHSGVNRSLARICDDCLQFRPENRPPSMKQVADRLKRERSIVPRATRAVQARKRRATVAAVVAAVAIVVGLVFVATRAPYAVRMYRAAVSASAAGDIQTCTSFLANALDSNPDYLEARLLRARCYLQTGDLASAKLDLLKLVEDARYPAAYPWVGYYYNLTGEHAAAIVWYQKTLDEGLRSASILNNLGASLLLAGRSPLSTEDRLQAAARNLEEALAALAALAAQADQAESNTIRKNAARVDVALLHGGWKPGSEASPDLADWLHRRLPHDAEAQLLAFEIFSALMEVDPAYGEKANTSFREAGRLGAPVDLAAIRSNPHYQSLREISEFADAAATIGAPQAVTPPDGAPHVGRFLAPLVNKP